MLSVEKLGLTKPFLYFIIMRKSIVLKNNILLIYNVNVYHVYGQTGKKPPRKIKNSERKAEKNPKGNIPKIYMGKIESFRKVNGAKRWKARVRGTR